MALPSASVSLGGTSTPETSCSTRSQLPTTSVNTTGVPARIASNGEVVLILFSINTGQYMNAYMPNPSCLSNRTRKRRDILAARQGVVGHCAAVTPAWQLLGATVEIEGVGFWNPATNTRGALRNGAELRPATNLSIDAGCGMPR